jgi:hypothetical protein
LSAVVVIGADELRALVRDAVAEALAASRASAPEAAPFLSLREFVARYNVSRRTGATWRREGMPCSLTASGRVRVNVAEADAWVRARVDRHSDTRARRLATSARRAAERAA